MALVFAAAGGAGAAMRIPAVLFALTLSFAAAAEPVELKLAVFLSEQTKSYQSGIKPFVDAVNAEGKGLLAIKVYPDGALGKAIAEQPGLVAAGVADMAWIVPGQTPYRFPDNQLLELPGLLQDVREGTLVYTRLIAAGALRGYQDYLVIGAYMTDPTIIHSRKPTASLAALAGQRIRANNQIEAEALERLGAVPTVLPVLQMAGAISRGSIDGAALNPMAAFDFGVASLAKNHYLLRGGATPLVLVLSRRKFDSLPEAAQALIRKYSGDRAAETWIATYGAAERTSFDRLKADPERTLVEPAPAEQAAVQQKYKAMVETWASKSARNRDLVAAVDAQLKTIRPTR